LNSHENNPIDRSANLVQHFFGRHSTLPTDGTQATRDAFKTVGVQGGATAAVTGIQGLHHGQEFGSSNLTHSNTIGPHAQSLTNQAIERDFAGPFVVCLASLQRNEVT
jgi:hypothetical protein